MFNRASKFIQSSSNGAVDKVFGRKVLLRENHREVARLISTTSQNNKEYLQ